jgi:hypothetical protein
LRGSNTRQSGARARQRRANPDICKKIGGESEALIVGAIIGNMKPTKPHAAVAGSTHNADLRHEFERRYAPAFGAKAAASVCCTDLPSYDGQLLFFA